MKLFVWIVVVLTGVAVVGMNDDVVSVNVPMSHVIVVKQATKQTANPLVHWRLHDNTRLASVAVKGRAESQPSVKKTF